MTVQQPPARRYQVSHRTEYKYSDVVTSSYGRAHLVPRTSARQRCLQFDLHIDPLPADRSTSLDVYGNISSYFHVTERHQALCVLGTSMVEVDPPPAEHYESGAVLQPWESVRMFSKQGFDINFFTLKRSINLRHSLIPHS